MNDDGGGQRTPNDNNLESPQQDIFRGQLSCLWYFTRKCDSVVNENATVLLMRVESRYAFLSVLSKEVLRKVRHALRLYGSGQ